MSDEAVRKARSKVLASEYMLVLRFLRRRVRRASDADDLLQDVFVRFLSVDPHLQIASTRAFLLGIARHVLADFYENSQRERRLVEIDSHSASLVHAPDRHDCIAEQNARFDVTQCLRLLGRSQSSVLLACGLEGYSYKEAANRLGLALSTVEKYMTQAKAELRTSRLMHGMRRPASSPGVGKQTTRLRAPYVS